MAMSPPSVCRERVWRFYLEISRAGLISLVLLASMNAIGGDRVQHEPIIDMHLHALTFRPPGTPIPFWVPPGLERSPSETEMIRQTFQVLEEYNVVKAVTSGPYKEVRRWKTAAPDRIIASIAFPLPGSMNVSALREEYRTGRLEAFGEVIAQLMGLSLSDESFEPYYALCEELDIPVAVHTGFPPPGAAYDTYPKLRAALGNPLLLEEALLRHPKMRIYIMHAGYPFINETIALLHAHPRVYVDLGNIDWVLPRQEFHEHLRRLLQAGFGRRLMFGSDQGLYPEAVRMAIDGIDSARFLTAPEKSDIFYNNAVRFLRLDQHEGPSKDDQKSKKTAR
jgi:predicted TIM-barrel fold metal-dependent hydrolase